MVSGLIERRTARRSPAVHRLVAGALLLLALLPASAHAFREFPPNAKRGLLQSHEYPYYKIGKTTYRLSAGGRIYNPQNLIVMQASLSAQKAEIIYQVDMNGQLSAIWLLTAAEAQRFPKTPEPKPAAPGKK
jgi:hypothetical protein